MFEELKKLDRIPPVPAPPDWRKTEILNNRDGIMADARRFLQPDWWERPREAAGQELSSLLQRAGLGRLADTESEFEAKRDRQKHENERESTEGTEVSEVAEMQRDKGKRRQHLRAGDEEEQSQSWEHLMGRPDDDARDWLKRLGAKVDANASENRGFFGALEEHVSAKPAGARVADLNQQLVELCLRSLCSE